MAQMNAAYKELASEENLSSNSNFVKVQSQSSRHHRISTVVLSITTSIFAFATIYLSYELGNSCLVAQCPSSPYLFQYGYDTEWGAPKSAIAMQNVTYTGALRYNDTDSTYYREVDPSVPQYVGRPSPEIDKNWMGLLAGEYIVFSEAEAAQLDAPDNFQGHYFGE